MKKNHEYIDVYWAPYWNAAITYDLNHLFPSPVSLHEDCMSKYIPQKLPDVFLNCPAVTNKMKNTFVFENTVETHVKFENGNAMYAEPERLQRTSTLLHKPTMTNNMLVNYDYSLLFFSEESVVASMTSPYFHNVESNKYGMLVPGEFDIGKWYRPMNAEFNLWDGIDELHVAANDPILYVQFHTDKRIRLHRYQVTKRLSTIATSLIHINPLKRFAKLSEKYELFGRSQLRTQILNDIKNNIVQSSCE
jgi:hypothetical protein